MDLSIIILNWNTRGLLRQCLKGLKMFNYGLEYEIIVVDNGSKDGSVEMMKDEYSDVKLIKLNKNYGHSVGNNIGIAEAKGKYLMLLNTDVFFLDGGAIKKMFEYMEANPQVGIVGPKLLYADGMVQMSCFNRPTPAISAYRRTFLKKFSFIQQQIDKYLMKDWDHNENKEVDWLQGSCLMVRRSAMEKVGVLDKKYFAYFGDTDWCERFQKASFKVMYLADASAIHLHRRQSADHVGILSLFNKVTRIHIKDGITYFKKYLWA